MRAQSPSGPSRQTLLALVLAVLAGHGLLMWGGGSPLTLRLSPSPPTTLTQVRLVALPPSPRSVAPAPAVQRPAPRPSPVRADEPPEPQQAATPAPEPTPAAAAAELVAEASAAATAETSKPEAALARAEPPPAASSAPELPASVAWPVLPPGALPASRLLSYQLTGMDKGLTYHASGELRWQHNERDYELTLAVRAFLVGRRQWRSVGRIEPGGLAPVRFSDSWRQERAAHFDREQRRIVFSSNSTPAVLEPGAQDQISLYVQLAAAMAGASEPLGPGTRLQVQTATVRDAQPWSLVLEGSEPLRLEGQDIRALKWVCQPRNRFEARVEFWVTPESAWLPVRIRITQVSGSYIDLSLRGSEALPPLPAQGLAPAGPTAS